MASTPVRVVCLTFLMATVWSCAGSEPNATLVATDFAATIPKDGLPADVEETFYLLPSQTLAVLDFTNTAAFLPASSDSSTRSTGDVSSSAYVFENGECNFDEIIEYTQLFPGYEAPVWVRASSSVEGVEEEDSASVTTYRFTNPPKENLNGGVSFCVRFKAVRAPSPDSEGTLTTTQKPVIVETETAPPTSQPPQTNGGSSDNVAGESDGGLAGGSGGGGGGSTGEGSTVAPPAAGKPTDGGQNENTSSSGHGESSGIPSGSVSDSSPDGDGHKTEEQLPQEEKQELLDGSSKVEGDSPSGPSVSSPTGTPVQRDALGSGSLSRRLSEQHDTKETFYLTIKVHSAAWSLANSKAPLLIALPPMAAAMLQIF
ncbi:unnamed protein product [Neospora caninum Liverpool]|uniref:Toxoplasma gondii family A protein n=1 Tax=Neospora caninum (strain Liverpool) TaxID=572307 RepID=F0VB99_NEOCL|nr:uncharacterized protein NCLIV_039580 [Neospora caninum Liverpool]CBZ50883.1 unnamed protein product [Neospora caninum Liverpool]CEL68185.1 TPA: Toxoplasma gondii family A protein [Neospora caninum Liverpool]|eukprot:XP_003880916.1 uncharacterized protein NCLIV_039580 [Neospora caninum Liverpool]